jgi:signal peptide peptidase SppA
MKIAFWRKTRVAVIELHGIIAPRKGALNIADLTEPLRGAFAAAGKLPVVLDIESPGGSPVQSDLIAAEIRRLADKHNVRVHAVIREVGASGGYWLACAADEIHANPMSLVGSIGVRGGGFGVPALLQRLGVEHRLYTAGSNKARFDPFSAERPEDVAFAHALMDELHTRFKDWVRTRRSTRLTTDESAIFDGSFMLGARARELGLIDGFGDVASVVRQLGGEKARARRFGPAKRGWLRRLPRLAVDAVFDAIEDRAARITLR